MAQAKKMLSKLKRYAEGGEVSEFPEEQASPTQQDLSEAAKRLLYYKKTAAPTPPTDLARLGKQAGLIGLGFAPGSGVADYFGKFPAVEGGTEPSAVENFQKGNYGTAALQGLGAMGDLAMAVPVAGAAIGSVMKAPRTAQRILSSSTTAKDDLAKMPKAPKAESSESLTKMLEKSVVKEPVYHASKADVKTFSPEYKTELSSMGYHFGTADQANFRTGQYDFSGDNVNIGKYYLDIKNPLETSHMGSFAPDHLADQMMDMGILDPAKYDALASKLDYESVPLGNALVKILKKNGYDGLKYANEREGEGFSFVPFDATQIKSAIGNKGTYDPTSPDITKAKGGAVRKPK